MQRKISCALMNISLWSLFPWLFPAIRFLFSRFWDLAYPERSYVVAGSTSSPSVSYYRKIIEGTEVVQVQAVFSLPTSVGKNMAFRNTKLIKISGFCQEWQCFFEFKKYVNFLWLFCIFLSELLLRYNQHIQSAHISIWLKVSALYSWLGPWDNLMRKYI